ncbi:MAG TPA: nucleoid occlusion protein [Firmicutes bacterium]|nr:nucleoid occlusion protein [Bacillota bacterium]
MRSKQKSPNRVGVSVTQADNIPNFVEDDVQSLPISRIEPNPFQPRISFDPEPLQELAESIATHGLLHPIIVRLVDQRYQLVTGERRLRACKLLGWTTIPAVVKIMDDRTAAEMALIENLQRRDLHFLEEAEGYQKLIAEFELTQEELAKRIGKSQSSIANRLRLLRLDPDIRSIISREMISERHARALLQLESSQEQMEVLGIITAQSLSVRETEELIRKKLQQKAAPSKQNRKIVIKDIRLFTNGVKELTRSLTNSGLQVTYKEDEDEGFYRVTVTIKKPEGRD